MPTYPQNNYGYLPVQIINGDEPVSALNPLPNSTSVLGSSIPLVVGNADNPISVAMTPVKIIINDEIVSGINELPLRFV